MRFGNLLRFVSPRLLFCFCTFLAGLPGLAQSPIAFDNEAFRARVSSTISVAEAMETTASVSAGQERIWRMSGPFGGDVASLAIDPRNSRRLLVGTNDGQLFRSNDEGLTWQRLKPGVNAIGHSLGIIHFDTERANVIYIGAVQIKDAVSDAAGGAIFVSTDGGESWREIEAMRGRSIRGFVQSVNDTNLLLVAARDGIYRSKDRGTSWERITPDDDPELRNFHSVATDPRDTNTIYVGTTHLPWKTHDGGLTWERFGHKDNGVLDDSDIFCIRIDGTNPDTVFMSACSGIYKTLNAGVKWAKLSGIPFTSRRTHVIYQHPARPEVVFAGTTEGLWRSINGGQTWGLVTNRRQVIHAVAAHPEQPDRIYIGTEDSGILVSTDGGDTFEPSNLGFINRQIRVVAHDRTERGRVYAGVIFDYAHGGLFVSEDDGLTWQPSGRGMGIGDVYTLYQSATNPATIYAGTNHGLYRSDDRALSWTKVVKVQDLPPTPPTPEPVIKNIVQRPQKSTGKGKPTPASKTTTQPRNPIIKQPVLPEPTEPTEPPPPPDDKVELQKQIFSLAPIYPRSADEAPGLIAATWDGLFITRDEKKGWKQLKFENAMHPYFNVVTTHPLVPGVIMVGTEDKLFVSHDNGESFAPMTVANKPLRFLNVVFDPRDPLTIYVGTNDGFFLTYNGGKTWQPRGNGMRTAIAVRAIAVNPANPDEVYVADERQSGMYFSKDKGNSWEPIEIQRLPSQRLYAMSANPFDATSLCIGSYSGGVYVMSKQTAGRKRQVGQ